jgi:hypothetical protein
LNIQLATNPDGHKELKARPVRLALAFVQLDDLQINPIGFSLLFGWQKRPEPAPAKGLFSREAREGEVCQVIFVLELSGIKNNKRHAARALPTFESPYLESNACEVLAPETHYSAKWCEGTQ